MPEGPKGQKPPADVIRNAIRVAGIATGEAEEEYEDHAGKDQAATELGRRGGKARADEMRAKERVTAAPRAAAAHWKT